VFYILYVARLVEALDLMVAWAVDRQQVTVVVALLDLELPMVLLVVARSTPV
jgi:hypothetical protein